MRKVVFAYPGDLELPTGGYGYDRRIIAGLRDRGWEVELLPLGPGFPFPSPETLADATAKLQALAGETLLVVDGLAFGVMADAAEAVSGRLSLIALVHHPLCQENGLGSDQASELLEKERKALAFARHVIVTSPATAAQVTDLFNVPQDRITVICPGTEVSQAFGRTPSEMLKLLSVGTVVPRKGYDLLFKALAELEQLDWHLDIVGGLDADPDCYQALSAQVSELDLSGRITFHGAVQSVDLADFYRNADVFVLASRYEGYGMAYTEALAHGLPVIGSGGGAVKETLPRSAAIYCGTEDVKLLREALDLVISDRAKRMEMAEAARKAASTFPTWQNATDQFAHTLEVAYL